MDTEKSDIRDQILTDDSETNKNKSDFYLKFDNTVYEGEKNKLQLKALNRFIELRDHWSKWIIGWITAFICFHFALTACVGLQWLDFQHTPLLIPSLFIENFLQVLGMGYIVTKFLYKNH